MGVVQSTVGHFPPVSDLLRSEVFIICGIAQALLPPEQAAHFSRYAENYDRIRTDIEAVIPGFTDFNTRIREAGGFYLPNGPRQRQFSTDIKKARFTANSLLPRDLSPDMLIMQTLRTHDQYNTTVYGMEDRYRGIYNDRWVIMMNPADMEQRGLNTLDKADITSHFQDETREMKSVTVIPYKMPKGACATYFPEANVLIPLHKTALISNTPTSKSIPVTIKKSDG